MLPWLGLLPGQRDAKRPGLSSSFMLLGKKQQLLEAEVLLSRQGTVSSSAV